jgi:hypothetical protein
MESRVDTEMKKIMPLYNYQRKNQAFSTKATLNINKDS